MEQLKSLISGGVGGICLVLAGQPFDLLKVRMQTATAGAPGSDMMSLVRHTFKTSGLRGFYVGVTPLLIGVTPVFGACRGAARWSARSAAPQLTHTQRPARRDAADPAPHCAVPALPPGWPLAALCFWAYDLGRTTIRDYRQLDSVAQLSLTEVGIAGAGSAIPTTLITAPGERIKVILQTQGHNPAGAAGTGPAVVHSGPLDVVRHLLKTGGISSVFRGASATFARDSLGSFAYFGAYEAIKRRFTPEGGGLSPTAILLGGSAAGIGG